MNSGKDKVAGDDDQKQIPANRCKGRFCARQEFWVVCFSFALSLPFLWFGLPAQGQERDSELPVVGATCEDSLAAGWIQKNLAEVPILSGEFEGRVEVEAPMVLDGVMVSEARYALSVRDQKLPFDPRAALLNVHVSDLRSKTKFGGGIKTHKASPNMELFLVNVTIDPNWPHWISYANTNYDGLVLDGAEAIYAQNLTIMNWNADAAIDNKARMSQLVDLTISGPGYRPIRYWRPGPHYLVNASIRREGEGILFWFKECEGTTVFVHNSVFNGEPQVPNDMIDCEQGSSPNIVYLPEDPRIKGEMHPMFQVCAKE
ncbi:hypothetical protein [Shimia sediminis]|uniref:hypothetical protein n=1 Tax=Shimia sediminis TaxID=2497945 RepID=UPI0013DF845C|nr:hypothetical protein [Shimia sediminis]